MNVLRERDKEPWDVLIIGGGATGLGTAVEAASRGYQTVLVEQHDFAKGTSSRSTKLVHGGVRYLQQGDIGLVFEALHERGLLRQNAPHLVHNLAFVIPNYEWWNGPFYTLGMKIYDAMAGKLGLGPSQHISKEETMQAIPNLKEEGLHGGVIYYDGQFDDSRLAINLAQTAVNHGAIVLNYCRVKGLLKSKDQLVEGVLVEDLESGETFSVYSRTVINATGVFADSILQMDEPGSPKKISPSQGIHLVLNKDFLAGDSAIMIPKTADGRVLFAVPWHKKVVVGTTDTLVKKESLEPRALEEEILFILDTAAQYLTKTPKRSDVKSIFAGLRPLAASKNGKSSKEISRSHKVLVSLSGLISTIGGKWTTYRKMGEDTVNKAILVGDLTERPSVTKSLPIHGATTDVENENPLSIYGTDKKFILDLVNRKEDWGERLHPDLDYIRAEVIWAVRSEMARNIEDVLARRLRALFLDARASLEMAAEVASLIGPELGRPKDWEEKQVTEYQKLARGYLLE